VPSSFASLKWKTARESINKKGRIQGIRSTSTLSNRTSGIVGSLAFGDPIAAIFTTAGSACVLRFSEPEITLPAGAEMLGQLSAPLDLPTAEAKFVPPIVDTPKGREDLSVMVHKLQFPHLHRRKQREAFRPDKSGLHRSATALTRASRQAGGDR